MNNIARYFKERFPPLLAIFLSAGYAAYLIGMWQRIGGQIDGVLLTSFLVGISFLFLLLRQRILDEFKDYNHDRKNYPNRPLQRGLVTKRQLIIIGIVAFAGELGSILLISPLALAYYVPVLIYSLLMAKEFFVGEWLKKRQTLYFISHQSVYILLALWACMVFKVEFSLNAVIATIALVCVMAGAEIVRKYEVRKNARGKRVNDTYITSWGLTGARTVLEFMIAIPAIVIAMVSNNITPCVVALIGIIFIEIFSHKEIYTRLLAAIIFVIQAVLVFVL